MQRDDRHLYRISTHEPYCFHAGTSRDGRQVLIGLLCPDLVALFFDSDGALLDLEKRPLDFLRPSGVIVDGEAVEGQVGTFDIHDERIPHHLRSWQNEIGFTPCTIAVRRFFVPELGVGIQDAPDHFAEILADPNSSKDEKRDIRESMRCWNANGQFVLWWGNDYWLNATGEVTSS